MGDSVLANILGIWSGGLLFAVIHSGLATQRVKDKFQARGMSPQRYRLLYSLLGLLLTAAWLLFVHSLPDRPLYHVDAPWRGLLRGVQLLGLGIFVSSLVPIDVAAFLGLRPESRGAEPFVERGIYRHLRHPMYTGIILMLLAHPDQTVNRLSLYAFVTAYLIVGARFEERRMLAAHPEYADYRRRVPAFLPRLWRSQALPRE